MEIRRVMKSVLLITVALILTAPLLPGSTYAWDNVQAHPEINRQAIILFQQRVVSESSLSAFKNSSLNGDPCYGMAWDPGDGNALIQRQPSVNRQKPLINWIIDGGYSADEPEGPAALRHFYDPTNQGHLTDTDWIAGFLKLTLGTQAVNPEISAVEWAMNEDEGLGKMDTIFSQNYSYPDAKEYFTLALADKSRDNPNYGNAWRAVGETMHLVADMGCPAHVRNDGHGLGDADPVEYATTAANISQYNNTNWTRTINYDQSIRGLMHDLANYTNKNFFSKDTILVAGQAKTANGQTAYASPGISTLTINNSGYLEGKVDGVTVKFARQSGWYRWGLTKNPGYVIDKAVIADQQKILTPTVVRAAEAVIERFLPRFEVQAQVKPDADNKGKYVVIGSISQQPSPEWNGRLTIRNGAYVVINGKKEVVKLYNNDNLNEFSHTISAKSGDQVQVIYDLGGYAIKSDVVKVADLTIDPPVLKGETNKEYTFKAVTTSPPANPSYEWYVDGVLKQNNANSSFITKFSQEGEHNVTLTLKEANKELGTAESKVSIEKAATTATGYWQYKGTWHTEVRQVDPIYTSQKWDVTTITDGAISAVEKVRDNSVETKPWLEKTFKYNWSVSAKNGNYKDKLYPGDEVTVSMNLNYVGVDPKKLGGGARIYCGGFDKYPQDNIIRAYNPGGSGTLTVTLPVTQGYKGATAFIKVHCEGGYQPFEFAYLYEWVQP